MNQLPLKGKCIVSTRPCSFNSDDRLGILLESAGAEVIDLPVLEICPIEFSSECLEVLQSVTKEDWLLFTSANGVWAYCLGMKDQKAQLEACRVAVIGEGTASAARECGLAPSFVARVSTSEGFAEEFVSYLKSQHVLSNLSKLVLLRGELASDNLPHLLQVGCKDIAQDIQVLEYKVYAQRRYQPPASNLSRLTIGLEENASSEIDMLIFTSSQSILNFMELLKQQTWANEVSWRSRLEQIPVAVIGPKTADTARDSGLQLEVVPERSSIESLVEAIVSYYS